MQSSPPPAAHKFWGDNLLLGSRSMEIMFSFNKRTQFCHWTRAIMYKVINYVLFCFLSIKKMSQMSIKRNLPCHSAKIVRDVVQAQRRRFEFQWTWNVENFSLSTKIIFQTILKPAHDYDAYAIFLRFLWLFGISLNDLIRVMKVQCMFLFRRRHFGRKLWATQRK